MKKHKNYWIIGVGDPTPESKTDTVRLFRSGLLAKTLAEQKNNVLWYSTNFNHATKTHRKLAKNTLNITDQLSIYYLYGIPYKKNVSVTRILNHLLLSVEFLIVGLFSKKPQIIILNYPTIELSFVGVLLARLFKFKSVIDVRDLWPDDLISVLPEKYQQFGQYIALPYQTMAKYIFQNCDAITGVTPSYIKWSEKYSKQNNNIPKKAFHLSTTVQSINEKLIHDKSELIKKGLCKFCFSGMLGNSVNLVKYVTLFDFLESQGWSLSVDICGAGDKYDYYKKAFSNKQYFKFHGFLNLKDLQNVIKYSHFGIVPYFVSGSLTKNIPNKIGEYLSYGLPIINSLKGETNQFIVNNNVGHSYLNDNIETRCNILKIFENYKSSPELYIHNANHALSIHNDKFNSEKVYLEYCNWLNTI